MSDPTAAPPPPADPGQWGDLTTRLISGAVIAIGSLAALWAGGLWFQMLVIAATALMIWEVWTMVAPDRAAHGSFVAVLTAVLLFGVAELDTGLALLLLLIVPAAGLTLSSERGWLFLLFSAGIVFAGWGLIVFRQELGISWTLWLVLVVAASDVAGYFAGRTIGGPKFWPSISPKKTWSGTIAGWLAAAALGLIFVIATDAGPSLILLSVIACFAGQMGDIVQSALKRRMGVKDSSDLIPGHGGVYDRFDALMGATLVMLVLTIGLQFAGGLG